MSHPTLLFLRRLALMPYGKMACAALEGGMEAELPAILSTCVAAGLVFGFVLEAGAVAAVRGPHPCRAWPLRVKNFGGAVMTIDQMLAHVRFRELMLTIETYAPGARFAYIVPVASQGAMPAALAALIAHGALADGQFDGVSLCATVGSVSVKEPAVIAALTTV